eukprot:7426542-Pyramimonas_sp.AAC.1
MPGRGWSVAGAWWGAWLRVSVGFGREVVGWGKGGPKNRGSKEGSQEEGIGRWLLERRSSR